MRFIRKRFLDSFLNLAHLKNKLETTKQRLELANRRHADLKKAHEDIVKNREIQQMELDKLPPGDKQLYITAYQMKQQQEDEYFRQETQKCVKEIEQVTREYEEAKTQLLEEEKRAPQWSNGNIQANKTAERQVIYQKIVAQRKATVKKEQQLRQGLIIDKLQKELGQHRFNALQETIGKVPGGFVPVDSANPSIHLTPTSIASAPNQTPVNTNGNQQLGQTHGTNTPIQSQLGFHPMQVVQTQQVYPPSPLQTGPYPAVSDPRITGNFSSPIHSQQGQQPIQTQPFPNQYSQPPTNMGQSNPQYIQTNPQYYTPPQYSQTNPQYAHSNPQYAQTYSQQNSTRQHPPLNITNEEKQYYDYYFHVATQGRLDCVTMNDAHFFRYSNLSNDHLIEVWRLASLGERQLTRDQFHVAMRLISLAQQNQPITLELINYQLPLPQIFLPQPNK